MAEYILRDQAIIAVTGAKLPDVSASGRPIANGKRSVTDCVRRLKEIPAADVRPVVQGKWIPDYDYAEYDFDGSTPLLEPRKYQDGWQCSLCGQYMPSEENFCPNCGADMREER